MHNTYNSLLCRVKKIMGTLKTILLIVAAFQAAFDPAQADSFDDAILGYMNETSIRGASVAFYDGVSFR